MAITVSPNYRRGRAKSMHDQEVIKAWHEFAREHNIADKNIASYYGINASAGHPPYSVSQVLIILKELFRDLVSTNSLVLPQGMNVEDYEIVLETSPRPPYLDVIMLRELQSQRQAKVTNHADGSGLYSESKMDGPHLHRMIRGIVKAVDML